MIVSERVPCVPLLCGGPQETRWRAGTENVVGILSFGLAIRALKTSFDKRIEKMRDGCKLLAQDLAASIDGLSFNSNPCGLPNTLNLTIQGVRADDLVVALDVEGILVSSGAACASGKPEPSHVLLALGLTPEEARQSIRISLNGMHSEDELSQAARTIISGVKRMREKSE